MWHHVLLCLSLNTGISAVAILLFWSQNQPYFEKTYSMSDKLPTAPQNVKYNTKTQIPITNFKT